MVRRPADRAAAWRHVVSVLLLPFSVVVLVPSWARASLREIDTQWHDSLAAGLGRAGGAAVFAAGLALFAWCVVLFARIGQGTLAPWDPTRRLVAAGPYRYIRNPMISGVALMLLGEAIFTGSAVLAAWFAVFLVVNQLYFIFSEEPGLERRFGTDYTRYKRDVPRWVPRRPR